VPSALLDEALAPLRANPVGAAILLDVDGTLAPIVDDPGAATVPASTRELLLTIIASYGLVACVTGRKALDARGVVGIEEITYIGAHGAERLAPGAEQPEIDPRVAASASVAQAWIDPGLLNAGVRREDKGAIIAFHWRGAEDQEAAAAAVRRTAERAHAEGLAVHWGRKVMELRPMLGINKGSAVIELVGEAAVDTALYAGDDVTDLDAFRALNAAPLRYSVCVGVSSPEQPPGLAQEADLLVDGTEGMAEVLAALVS
jgi:trehalose 6-phosphate phosphatase